MIERTRPLWIALVVAAFVLAAAAAKKRNGPDVVTGEEVFKKNCALCHYADKTDKRIGPGLKGLFQRDKLVDGRPVNEENVRSRVAAGGEKMPPFKNKLDGKQVDDLIGYLKTL